MSIIFNAFISRGKKVLFASKYIKQFYSTKLERQSRCCWVCSNSEPETSYQSLGQEADGQLLLGNHRIQASRGPLFPWLSPRGRHRESSAGHRAGRSSLLRLTVPHKLLINVLTDLPRNLCPHCRLRRHHQLMAPTRYLGRPFNPVSTTLQGSPGRSTLSAPFRPFTFSPFHLAP